MHHAQSWFFLGICFRIQQSEGMKFGPGSGFLFFRILLFFLFYLLEMLVGNHVYAVLIEKKKLELANI